MVARTLDRGLPNPGEALDQRGKLAEEGAAANRRLHRWQVSFRGGAEWFPVDAFVAPDAATAIERAVDIFGAVEECRAEEIPWDTAKEMQ